MNRRQFLAATGASLATATLAGTAAADSGWTTRETPTGNTLYDVVDAADGVYAVGGGGVLLERTESGYRTVFDGGPTGNGNDLYGADVTDGGLRIWLVGASGAIGEYDVASGVLYDHSAPNDVTNNFNDVAATGVADDANVYVAGDSGHVYYSFEDGESGTWDDVTPGSGAAIRAIDFFGARSGHLVDGNQRVFATDDGTTWDAVGLQDADHGLYGVDADGFDDVTVSGGGGSVWTWDGSQWRREDTGDATLRDVEVGDGGALTVGGGGKIYRHDADGWQQEATPVGDNLKAVLPGDPDVAVGAGGTALEHEGGGRAPTAPLRRR